MTEGIGISPDFLALIKQAARETVSIQLPSHKLAIQMRQRLHSARKQLFRRASSTTATLEDRAYSELAQQIETAIENSPNGGVTLLVRPRDSVFRDAIAKAGVKIDSPDMPDLSQGELPGPASPPASPVDILDKYLKPKEGT